MTDTERVSYGSKEALDRPVKEHDKELALGPGLGSMSPQHSKRQKTHSDARTVVKIQLYFEQTANCFLIRLRAIMR